ncbi:MAG TPA: glycosyltransferase, partial [Thermoanaerobaculia bacterium]|nr:glycosyltransferase [Thermoanaerobaculia bacterium]
LYDALRPETRERLRRVIEERRASAHFHDLRPILEREPGYQGRSAHFHRLLAPEVLPPGIERFLYLDCDVVVKGDIGELARALPDLKVAAACRDYFGCIRDAVANHQSLGLAGDAPYFNSGVMLIDRASWLGHRVSERVLECTERNMEHLYAQGRFFQYDQYGLNVVLYGKWEMLDSYWNYGAEYPFSEAGVIHFNGHGKPWSPSCTPEFRRDFYAYLHRAGWREEELREES